MQTPAAREIVVSVQLIALGPVLSPLRMAIILAATLLGGFRARRGVRFAPLATTAPAMRGYEQKLPAQRGLTALHRGPRATPRV